MGVIYLRKYGVQTTIDFALYELDGTDLLTNAAYAAGDVKIMKDEGAEANTTNSFTDEGSTYSIVLTATEMEAARIALILIDQTAPKVWLDRALYIETYGHASGQHAFDLATATVNLSAASEAQLDAIETDTNEVQGKLPTNKIMGSSVVTDKDDEIDAIKTMTDKIGTVTNTGGTATIGAVLGDFANSALVTRVATVDTVVDGIDTVLDNVHDTDLPAVLTAVTAVQNNTRFTAAVPEYLSKPDAGNQAFRISSNLYDTLGNMEDPDNAEVMVRIVKNDGTFITATLYKENALANALDNATNLVTFPVADGWRALERDAAGRFFCFYKVANDATEESLTVEFGWEEATVANYQSRSAEIADVNGDLSAILSDTAAILTDTNELQTDWVNGGRLDLLVDSTISKVDAVDDYVDTEVAAIKAVTDTLTLTAIADAVHDEVTETGVTHRQSIRLMLAALAGKSSGGGTNDIRFRNQADNTDRIRATVDANGNRTAIVTDP